jgi:hypothetical protein
MVAGKWSLVRLTQNNAGTAVIRGDRPWQSPKPSEHQFEEVFGDGRQASGAGQVARRPTQGVRVPVEFFRYARTTPSAHVPPPPRAGGTAGR